MRLSLLVAVATAITLRSNAALAEDACERSGFLVSTGIGTWSEELIRLADLSPGTLAPQSGLLRHGSVTARPLCSGHPALVWGEKYVVASELRGIEVVPPKLDLAYQSLAPGGSNDGMLWQGRGFSSLLGGGVRGAWDHFSFQLAPEVTWSQNRHFRMVDTGGQGDLRFRNPWYGGSLDVPQRYGDGQRARIGFGQSYAAVEGFGARLALSTENLWWGPGIRNSLLLTNNAEGFPHLSLATSRPLDIWIGHVEAEMFLGRLRRTKYLEQRFTPWFTGIAATYQPRWIPGLYLGAGRTFVEDERTLRNNAYLSVFQSTNKNRVGDNPRDNQIASVWFRWVMPEIELYGEYGLDDYISTYGLSRVPDRAAAWTLGFQKRWVQGPRWWRVVGELAKTRSNFPPGHETWFYTHPSGADYTNDGQLLGASIGPGADTQYLAVDAFVPSGRIGGYFERVRRNEDIYWARFADSNTTDHDVELVLGLRQVIFTRKVEIGWDIGAGYHYNRDFLQRFATTFRGMLTLTMPFESRPQLLGSAARTAEAAAPQP